MNIRTLDSKWKNISMFNDNNGYKSIRISSDCIPDLFIAVDEDGLRCLLLFLPSDTEVRLKGSDKEKLTLSYLKHKNTVMIRLNDHKFFDLFNELILSLYSKINNIIEPKKYSGELISSFYKWAEFFEDKLDRKMSLEEIKGLFGELFVLNELLVESESSDINSILESWKGPYNNTHDFIFDDKNIEVKTKNESKLHVKISSEHQLESEYDKGLELLVLSIKTDLVNGESIYDLINKSIRVIRKQFGDVTILYRALMQKGLNIESSKIYNNNRFIVVRKNTYDCLKETFPKLSVSNIPKEITKLRYDLRVSTLDDYLTEEKHY